MIKFKSTFLMATLMLLLSLQLANSAVEIGSNSYTTLKDAFDAINSGTHTGDIVIKVTSNCSETAAAVLMASGNGSADYTSVAIYPTGTYTISGSISTGLIELRGADNVTIDGREGQSGSTRSLTINNTNSGASAVIWLDSLISGTGAGAKNNKILYCNIKGGGMASSYGIAMGSSSSITTAGAGLDDNEIGNNLITNCYYAIRVYGLSAGRNKNLKVYGNTLGSTTSTETIKYAGIYVYYASYAEIYDNILESFTNTSTIYGIYNYYSEYSKVYNNELRNFSNTSSTYMCYNYQATQVEIYDNVIKNASTSSTIYNFYISSCPSSNVHDNLVDNVKTSGSSNYIYYLTSCGSSKVENNKAQNVSASSTIYSLYLRSSTSSKANNNEFNNITSTAGTIYGLYLPSSGSSEVKGNTLKNFTASSTLYGVYLSSSTYTNLYDNVFENFVTNNSTGYCFYLTSSGYCELINNSFNGMTAFNYAYGMYLSTSTELKIERNVISELTGNGTSATAAIGLYCLGTTNNLRIVNNSFSYLRSTNYSTTGTTTNPIGILLTSGTGHKVYYNSVSLSGTQVNVGSTASLSAAFMVSSTAVNSIDVRNNVFANTLAGLNGTKSYSIYLVGSGNLTNSTIDYNDYYVAGNNGILGYFAGTDASSLSSWQSYTSQDNGSISIDPFFNSYLNTSPAPGSQIVGKGTAISGITSDILGNTRNSTTPTPGAYENAADIVGPMIEFTHLQTTTVTTNRTLLATITDLSGINTTTSAPRLYYRKSTNANTFNNNVNTSDGWKYATPIINGSDYTFTIDYSKIYGGATTGDFIEYFIIAQDNASAGNISISKGKFAVTPTSTNLSSSDFPFNADFQYGLASSLSGTYNVGSSETYTSLTSSGGFFEKASQSVLTGNVVVNITSDLSETGAFELNVLPEEFGSDYTITIQPSSNTKRKISGSFAGGLIRIIGANNVTIDGSYQGEGRYLEFSNTVTSGTRAVLILGGGGATINGGKNTTVKNSIFYNGASSSTSMGIIISDGTVSTSATTATSMDNLLIQNNVIYRTQYGIFARATAGNPFNNMIIEKNEIGSETTSDYILQYGMNIQNAPDCHIRYNKVFNIIQSTTSNNWGISVGGTTGKTIIDGNLIYSIKYNGTGGWGCYGVNLIGGSNHVVTNNMITDITTDRYSKTSTTYNPFGIRITTGSAHKILFNTINMSGTQGGTNSVASLTANILFSTLLSSMDIRGNILHNSLEGVSGTNSYNIFTYTTSAITGEFSILDNNMYSVSGAAAKVGGNGTSVPFKDYPDLTEWQTATGKDPNSVTDKPTFLGTYDLHLSGSVVGDTDYMLNRTIDLVTDKDGETRNASTYYGADEVNPIFGITKQTTLSPNSAVYCYDEQLDISAAAGITGYGDGVSRSGAPAIAYQWFKNDAELDGFTSSNINIKNVAQADSANYYMKAFFMNEVLTTNTVDVIVQGPIVMTQDIGNADVCNTDPFLELKTDAIGTLNTDAYQWEKFDTKTGSWIDITDASSKVLFIPLARPEDAIGKYRARIMGPGNCGASLVYTSESNVFVTEPIKDLNITLNVDPKAICTGDKMVFKASAKGTIYGYRWQFTNGSSFVDLPLEEFPTADTDELIIENALPGNSGQYRCMIYGSYACGNAFTPSAPIEATVFPFFAISEHPQEQIVCEGGDIFLNVYAEGLIYKYQWYKDDIAIPLSENKYANSQILMLSNASFDHSGLYYCKLTIEDCSGIKDVPSKPAAVYVATDTRITKAPETQAAAIGGSAIFTLRAHVNGLPKTYNLPVQWYKGNTRLVDDGRIQGANSQILSISDIRESDFGEDYRVIVTGLCGSAEAKDFGLVKVDINITSHPQSILLCEKQMAVFNVTAVSSIGDQSITYQWYKDDIVLSDNGKASGTQTNKLIISNINATDNGEYYVRVGLKGAPNTATSLPANLFVDLLPIITLDLENEVTAKVGDLQTLYITATGENLDYQWYFNGTKIISANEDTYLIDEITEANAGDYYVEIKNQCGTIKSNTTKMTVTNKTTSDVVPGSDYNYSISKPTPHPVTNLSQFNFIVPFTTDVVIELYNMNGSKIAQLFNGIANQGENTVTINASNLKLISGTYMIVLKNKTVTLTETITIIR